MHYEDRIRIQTPEAVDLELTLAGVGSRFIAALVDAIIQVILVVAAALVLLGGGALFEAETESGVGAAIFFVVLFLVYFAYDVLFEVLAAGRTPGKRRAGLRVVRTGGEPVGLLTSAIRNSLRLVDFLPSAYLVGCIAILATHRNQRLGDIAAGTLVVRDPERREPALRAPVPAPRAALDELAAWDVSAITADELAAVRRYLERRDDVTAAARYELARALASRLRPKVAGVPAGTPDERFLELLAAVKATRG